jgi:hypothetical protein
LNYIRAKKLKSFDRKTPHGVICGGAVFNTSRPTKGVDMPSPVNRHRRKKAFMRGYDRPQTFNPYKNPVLDSLWKRGKEARLKKTGGIMPPPPQKKERRIAPSRHSSSGGPSRYSTRSQPGQRRGTW